MTEVLSQDEIDQLLTVISAGDTDGEEKPHHRNRKNIKIYDFKRPDMFTRTQIKNIYKKFNPAIIRTSSELGKMSVGLSSVDQLTREELVRSCPTTTKWMVSYYPESDMSVVIEVTNAISKKLVPKLVTHIGKVLNATETDITDETTEFKVLTDTSPQDPYMVLSLEYFIPGEKDVTTEGVMTIAFPAGQLARLLGDKMETKDTFDIGNIVTTIDASLGSAKANISELEYLGEGSIITLDRQAGDPVPVFVDGKLYGRGEVVIIGDNFGVRLTEVFK